MISDEQKDRESNGIKKKLANGKSFFSPALKKFDRPREVI